MASFLDQLKSLSVADKLNFSAADNHAKYSEIFTPLLSHIEEHARAGLKLDEELLEKSALSEYAAEMQTVENLAAVNPHGNHEFIAKKSDELINALADRYGAFSDNFLLNARKIRDDSVNRYFLRLNKNLNNHTISGLRKTTTNLALNSNSISEAGFTKNLTEIRDAARPVLGDAESDINYDNALALGSARRALAEGRDVENAPLKSSFIANSSESPAMTSKVSTKIQSLVIDNPLLARGFLRIRGLSDTQGQEFSQKIRSELPDSPEADSIDLALFLRRQALAENPLQFAANQSMLAIPEHTADFFSETSDARFDAAKKTLELFGTTNFLTEQERSLIKNLSIDQKINIFSRLDQKVKAFAIAKKTDELNFYLYDELAKIDKSAFDIYSVKTELKDLSDVSASDILAAKENLKTQGSVKVFIPDELLNVPNIQGFLEIANAADIAKYGISDRHSLIQANQVFNFKSGYAYLKSYANGSDFQDFARELLKDKGVFLRNSDRDVYRVYAKDGSLIIKNGKPLVFSAQFLQAGLSKKAGG